MPAIILRVLIGLGLGAAAMYVLDPQTGRRRRRQLRDRAQSASRHAADAARKAARDLGNRARGTLAEWRTMRRPAEPVGDDVLTERVRARMGHLLSHADARAVDVSVHAGHVVLRGTLPADEASRVVAGVRSVRGVADVDAQIQTR